MRPKLRKIARTAQMHAGISVEFDIAPRNKSHLQRARIAPMPAFQTPPKTCSTLRATLNHTPFVPARKLHGKRRVLSQAPHALGMALLRPSNRQSGAGKFHLLLLLSHSSRSSFTNLLTNLCLPINPARFPLPRTVSPLLCH